MQEFNEKNSKTTFFQSPALNIRNGGVNKLEELYCQNKMPKSSRSQIRAARRASEIAKQKRQMSRLSAHMNMDNQLFSSNDELNTNCCDEEKTEKVVETIIELPEGMNL